jgi:hypothetical protein
MSSDAVGEVFTLSEQEAQAVARAAGDYADALPPGSDAPYRLLAELAAAPGLAVAHVPLLERVCALALETGRARQLGGPDAERLLTAVHHRTPGGAALTTRAGEVNGVLAQLVGRTLRSARLTCQVPGRYRLDLGVDGFDVSIALDPQEQSVRSLQVS